MKKVLIAVMVALLSLGASIAQADDVMMDPGSLNTPLMGTYLGADGQTAAFQQLGTYIETISSVTPTGLTTGTFTDKGYAIVNSLINPYSTGDDEGVNASWSLYGSWSNLSGSTITTPLGGDGFYTAYTYDQGATLDLYAQAGADGTAYEFGHGVNGDYSLFGDTATAEKVVSLTLVAGEGGLTNTGNGFVELTWQVTWFDDEFWLDSTGNPFPLANGDTLIMAITDANTDNPVYVSWDGKTVLDGPSMDGETRFHIYSEHNGSLTMMTGVVPEPTSMLLLGSGLLGLAGAGFRKKRS